MLHFDIITIFPDFFESFKNFSIICKGLKSNKFSIEVHNLRNWSTDSSRHKKIDSRPYGGGAGMVFMVEPLYKAIESFRELRENLIVTIPTPSGKTLSQPMVRDFSKNSSNILIICPHYEGFDARILKYVDLEFSLGNFVLTGGELPAMVLIDSMVRLEEGVLGNSNSFREDSFYTLREDDSHKVIEHPQYTKPEVFIDHQGRESRVPKVLLSGNHHEIEDWRKKNTLVKPRSW